MLLALDRDKVKIFSPHTTLEPFTNDICLRRTTRRHQNLVRCTHSDPREGVTIFAIAIPYQKAGRLAKWCRFAQCLGHPCIGGWPRHPVVNNPPRCELDNEKEVADGTVGRWKSSRRPRYLSRDSSKRSQVGEAGLTGRTRRVYFRMACLASGSPGLSAFAHAFFL